MCHQIASPSPRKGTRFAGFEPGNYDHNVEKTEEKEKCLHGAGESGTALRASGDNIRVQGVADMLLEEINTHRDIPLPSRPS